MSFQVSDAMRSLVPNAKLHIINEDYDTMQWDASNTDTKPTKAEVQAEITCLNTRHSFTNIIRSLSLISFTFMYCI